MLGWWIVGLALAQDATPPEAEAAEVPEVVEPPPLPEEVAGEPPPADPLPPVLTPAKAPDDGTDPVVDHGFYAGSYGRAQATFDLTGGRGDPTNIARRGPRNEQGPYLELDLGWRYRTERKAEFGVLITPALSGDVFHYTGQFTAQLAVRNLYAEAKDFLPNVPLTVWAGSRMYRGDDIYLLDFWPMDNLNTLGGGFNVHPGNTEIAAHVGVNRLLGDDFQVQFRRVQVPDQVTGTDVLFLDRQRLVTSLRLTQQVPIGKFTLRFKLYGEVHHLPAGERLIENAFTAPTTETLPRDFGSMVGLQASVWGWAPQSFVHLWVRRTTGLAAYGELSIPRDGLADDLSGRGASSFMVAGTGNHETRWLGIMAAFYADHFQDADGQSIDFDDRWEFVGVVRPNFYPARHVAIGVELSHQHVAPRGANPWTGSSNEPDIFKFGLMPGVQLGPGGYARPRIQLVYQASLLDRAAQDFFSPLDQRVQGKMQHFIGIGAEWWVNSQRVITPDRPVGTPDAVRALMPGRRKR